MVGACASRTLFVHLNRLFESTSINNVQTKQAKVAAHIRQNGRLRNYGGWRMLEYVMRVRSS